MVKTHINISIEGDLAEKAKERLINISAITEKAIKERLNFKEIKIEDQCFFCKKVFTDDTGLEIHQVHATAKNPNIGLCWLCPDEKWICPSCLTRKMANAATMS